jgi:hypothetical protein
MGPSVGWASAGPYVKAWQLLNANFSRIIGAILNLKQPKCCKFNGL